MAKEITINKLSVASELSSESMKTTDLIVDGVSITEALKKIPEKWVKKVNGNEPDDDGNVTVESGSQEYTAFEVHPTDEIITAGTVDEVSGETYKVDVPAQMTFKIIVRSDGAGAWQGFKMDWGDGSSSTIEDAESISGNKATMSHTYETAGRFIVKVYGNIFGFSGENLEDSYKLISRVWDSDLPVASGCYSWKSVFLGNLRLQKVDIPYTFKWPRANLGLFYTFKNCKNLITFKSNATTPLCQSMQEMFNGCSNMETCKMEYEGYGIWKSVDGRYSTMFTNCSSLKTPLNQLIPTRGWMCQQIHMENMFQNCSSLPANIGGQQKCIADVLWKLEKHGWYFNRGSQGAFAGCSTELLDLIPISWGGTAPDPE